MTDFGGKTVVVTGRGPVIGLQMVRGFMARGARVFAADLNLSAASDTATAVTVDPRPRTARRERQHCHLGRGDHRRDRP